MARNNPKEIFVIFDKKVLDKECPFFQKNPVKVFLSKTMPNVPFFNDFELP